MLFPCLLTQRKNTHQIRLRPKLEGQWVETFSTPRGLTQNLPSQNLIHPPNFSRRILPINHAITTQDSAFLLLPIAKLDRYPDGQHNKQRRRLSCFTQSSSNGLSTSSTWYAEGKNPLQSAHNLGRLRVQQTRPSRVALRLSCRYLSCRSRTKNVIQDGKTDWPIEIKPRMTQL